MYDDNFFSMVKNRSFPLNTNRNLLKKQKETKKYPTILIQFFLKTGDNGI